MKFDRFYIGKDEIHSTNLTFWNKAQFSSVKPFDTIKKSMT